jgi:hypothetical protein
VHHTFAYCSSLRAELLSWLRVLLMLHRSQGVASELSSALVASCFEADLLRHLSSCWCLLFAVSRFEQLEQFAFKHEEAQQRRAELGRQRKRPLTFHKLLKCFASDSQLSGAYFLADMNNMMQLAKLLRQVEPHMVLADMYTCCISPASADDGPVVQVGWWSGWVRSWCRAGP